MKQTSHFGQRTCLTARINNLELLYILSTLLSAEVQTGEKYIGLHAKWLEDFFSHLRVNIKTNFQGEAGAAAIPLPVFGFAAAMAFPI